MTFDDILAQVLELLQRQGRVSYRALKRRFDIGDEYIEDLKAEIIQAQRLAVDEDGVVLVWTSDHAAAPGSPFPAAPRAPAEAPVAEPARELLSYTPSYLAEKILTSRSALEGERKQVTVLFADIKDSTELIRDLDPEDAQKLLDPAILIMMEAVHHFEGTVNQVLGDGIMSLFGAPIAHEDHAARACYAALAMQTVMQPYAEEVRRSHGITMRIRVGLNSGEVVVRTIGNDLHMDYSAVGQTTNLASRMEQLAAPGSVVLSAATLRLVEGLVRVDALGPVPVKGLNDPVEVYELTGASSIRRRLQAAVARGLTRFVGRDAEIEALTQALEQAGTGHGQIVAAVGEAGVGKSRLVYEFVHSHRTQGWLVLESASVSYGKATPYFPVVDLLKRYVHVEEGDDPRTIRAKVTGQILTLDASLQETIPALLSLLDALPEDSPFLKLDPPQRRPRTLDGLKRILLRESQVQPLLLVFEDLHWHDSETQALLDSLVESLPTAQLLLLVNYRPEYTHNWGSKTYCTQLRLAPLPPESADAFLEALLGDDASLEPLKKLLIERTEGNPFFLEESVRTLVETQVLTGEPGAYRLAQDLPSIQVPPTVQAVLAARIDRLSEDAKRLLQTAAVIGTEVPFALLQAIAEISDKELYQGLANLQAAEFLYETGLFPERVYTFKHALTHEVAYSSLLQERRRVLHARIVDTLETLGGDQLTEQVERLAHHALRGEVWDKALPYSRQVGVRAIARSANQEAVLWFEQALMALQYLPESQETVEQGIDVRFDLRNALQPLGDYQRILNHLSEAENFAKRLDDRSRLGQIFSFRAEYHNSTGDYAGAIASGQQVLALASESLALRVGAQLHLGCASYFLGDYRQAMDFLRRNVMSIDGESLYERFGRAGLPAAISRCWLVLCHAELGEFVEGIACGGEAVQIAEAVNQLYTLTLAYCVRGALYLRKGDIDTALPLLERGHTICQEANLRVFHLWLASELGYAYALSGRITEALQLLGHIERWGASVGTWFNRNSGLFVSYLGGLYLLANRLEEAHEYAEQALQNSQARNERGNQAWALRLLGDIAMHHNPPEFDQVATRYQQALTLANELGMRPLQAHCHRGLGTLYQQIGQADQARAELATTIEMYRDMEMTLWLPETEAALAALEGKA